MKLNHLVLALFLGLLSLKASAFQAEAFKRLKDDYSNTWSKEKDSKENLWLDHRKEIAKKWKDIKLSSVKTFVSYFDQLDSRVEIDFENGVVNIETLSTKALKSEELSEIYLRGIKKNQKLLLNQLNTNSLSIDLKKITSTSDEIRTQDGLKGKHYSTSVRMVPDHVKIRARSFLPLVRNFARNHSIPLELILAIIWQESAFNPMARSHIPAFGLMQIVPRFAGNEVKEFLGETHTVDGEFLFKPENNIKYGINYLSLLSGKYFSSINSFEQRVPFIIAGYNWGPSRLLKHIENGKIRITSQISIIEQIEAVAPEETKEYLVKVFEKWNRIRNDQWLTF